MNLGMVKKNQAKKERKMNECIWTRPALSSGERGVSKPYIDKLGDKDPMNRSPYQIYSTGKSAW